MSSTGRNSQIVSLEDLDFQEKLNLINIYAPNSSRDRLQLWEDLNDAIKNRKDDHWMLGGNFNSPLLPSEKSGGLDDYTNSMMELAGFLNFVGLIDIPLQGSKFTWSNRRNGNQMIQVKLDIFFISSNWNISQNFPLSSLPRSGYDHNTLVLKRNANHNNGPFPFRFEIMWSLYPDFVVLLKNWWEELVCGTPMFCLVEKLSRIK